MAKSVTHLPTVPRCAKREAVADGGCKHFLESGYCALPEEFECIDLDPVSGRIRPPAQTDLFGNVVVELVAPPRPSKPKQAPKAALVPPRGPHSADAADSAPAIIDTDQLRGLTHDDIESFRALGAEVRLESEVFGELWLVPVYTGDARKEITPENAATILRVLSAFPGSRIVSFEKKSPKPAPSAGEESSK